MISREAVERLFDQHNHQYPSARAWREALIDDLLALVPTPSREELEKIIAHTPVIEIGKLNGGRAELQRFMQQLLAWALGEPERTGWCSHCTWQSWPEGHWVGSVNPAGPQSAEFTIFDSFTVCPRCAAPRPNDARPQESSPGELKEVADG